MASTEVLTIIASLHGGFNGEVIDKQIGVEITSDTTAVYSLTRWEDGQPTADVERWALTLAPADAPDPL